MTLEELRTYHRLREYQISHLLNARKCHGHGKHAELNMWLFLLFWADAMYEADAIRDTNGFAHAVIRKMRGLA